MIGGGYVGPTRGGLQQRTRQLAPGGIGYLNPKGGGPIDTTGENDAMTGANMTRIPTSGTASGAWGQGTWEGDPWLAAMLKRRGFI